MNEKVTEPFLDVIKMTTLCEVFCFARIEGHSKANFPFLSSVTDMATRFSVKGTFFVFGPNAAGIS